MAMYDPFNQYGELAEPEVFGSGSRVTSTSGAISGDGYIPPEETKPLPTFVYPVEDDSGDNSVPPPPPPAPPQNGDEPTVQPPQSSVPPQVPGCSRPICNGSGGIPLTQPVNTGTPAPSTASSMVQEASGPGFSVQLSWGLALLIILVVYIVVRS